MPSTFPVYVINLDRSVHRLAQISAALHAIDIAFERVPAIDGFALDQRDLNCGYDAQENRRKYLAPLSAAEVACLLSHRRAWQSFLTRPDHLFAIFLEDDASPLPTCHHLPLIEQIFANSNRAELIKLYHPPSVRWVTPGVTHFRRPLVPPLGAVAYAMNRTAAQTLLEFTACFHEPVDVALQRWWDHGVRVSVVYPLLFGEATGTSTIRNASQAPFEGRLLREIRRPLFQIRRMLHAFSAVIQGRLP